MCKRPKATFISNPVNTSNLATTKVGSGFVRSTSTCTRKLKYVIVAVEYFSKWIEAKPLVTITSATVQKFFWQNIVCRFDVLKAITVDNGTQFDAKTFKDFCDRIGTKIHFASIRHP
jgi:IS30 family transposase